MMHTQMHIYALMYIVNKIKQQIMFLKDLCDFYTHYVDQHSVDGVKGMHIHIYSIIDVGCVKCVHPIKTQKNVLTINHSVDKNTPSIR